MAKRAVRNFSVGGGYGGVSRVNAGDLFPDEHPVVKSFSSLFEDVNEYVYRRFPDCVEQATAEPGEKRRGPGRPPKVRKEEPELSKDDE